MRARSTLAAPDRARDKGTMSKTTYLSAQLRELVPYLQDAGWRQTADLLLAAADEIEDLAGPARGSSGGGAERRRRCDASKGYRSQESLTNSGRLHLRSTEVANRDDLPAFSARGELHHLPRRVAGEWARDRRQDPKPARDRDRTDHRGGQGWWFDKAHVAIRSGSCIAPAKTRHGGWPEGRCDQ